MQVLRLQALNSFKGLCERESRGADRRTFGFDRWRLGPHVLFWEWVGRNGLVQKVGFAAWVQEQQLTCFCFW